jgi:two-component system, LytTR family, response regulator
VSEVRRRRIRVAIVDDEPLARQHIADRLAHEEDVVIAGEADDGEGAVTLLQREKPDVVFLDIQMPGLTGFEVIERVGVADMPVTIFTTAFDQYALRAFDVAAVDYLVKPFDDDRFAQAFQRARKTIELHEVDRATNDLLALLRARQESSGISPSPYLDRIPVEMRGQLRVVPVDRIDYITASGPYAELHVGERTYAVREKMQALEEKLDPEVFMRVHRSVIVRLELIDSMRRASGGDYAVRLKDGTELNVSRNRREELERKLGAK